MAVMLCEFEDCVNQGERDFFRYCDTNLGDEIVVYHNRYVNGQEFDFCLLIPNLGILIVEVKGWNKKTYQGVKNGQILILTEDEGLKRTDPYHQARQYTFSLSTSLRNSIHLHLPIVPVVCFTRWDDEFITSNHIAQYVGGHNRSILSLNDIQTRDRFYTKINQAFEKINREDNPFHEEHIIKVRDYFDPGYAKEVFEKQRALESSVVSNNNEHHSESNVNSIDSNHKANEIIKNSALLSTNVSTKVIPPYSIVAIASDEDEDLINHLISYYARGTKIYAILSSEKLQILVADKLTKLLQSVSVIPDGDHLLLSGDEIVIQPKEGIRIFGWSSFVVSKDNPISKAKLFVRDGEASKEDLAILKLIDNYGMINLQQYLVEHEDIYKNILVRAGAGTGKTSVMIDRITFLLYRHQICAAELQDRILMMTFTEAAAENMSQRLKQRFQDMYLLTGRNEYLSMIAQVNQMQISTIHSYALNLIRRFCVFSGFSSEVSVESGQYHRRNHLEETLEKIVQSKISQNPQYLQKLGLPLFEIREKILSFIGALENKSIDLTKLDPSSLGICVEKPLLHDLFMEVISNAESDYSEELKKTGKIFLGRLMPELLETVKRGEQANRLQEGLASKDRYMFVDEFQDSDDFQITAFLKIVDAMHYHLFCVGDQKQCIYRFRGAEEQAFDKLNIQQNKDEWKEHSLIHNYRSDEELLKAFEPYFTRWGKQNYLPYNPEIDLLDDPIHSNGGEVPLEQFMHRITVQSTEDRIPALVEEIQSRIKIIQEDPNNHRDKDRIIAVLVRENWQTRDIQDYLRKQKDDCGFILETESGGDLFQSDPALDMLTLCQALQQDDPPVLCHFIQSAFIRVPLQKGEICMLSQKQTQSNQLSPLIDYLHEVIDTRLKSMARVGDCRSLSEIRTKLRFYPVLQVLHQVYMQLRPWDYRLDGQMYRLNVDELFERFARNVTGGTSLDQLTEYLVVNTANN